MGPGRGELHTHSSLIFLFLGDCSSYDWSCSAGGEGHSFPPHSPGEGSPVSDGSVGRPGAALPTPALPPKGKAWFLPSVRTVVVVRERSRSGRRDLRVISFAACLKLVPQEAPRERVRMNRFGSQGAGLRAQGFRCEQERMRKDRNVT